MTVKMQVRLSPIMTDRPAIKIGGFNVGPTLDIFVYLMKKGNILMFIWLTVV